MNRLYIILPFLMAAGLFVASPAFALQNQANNPDRSLSMHENMGGSKLAMNSMNLRVKDLLGKEILNAKGKSIGKVSDVIIGRDGRADFVVLSHGGFFNDKYTPVPYKMFISYATNLNNLTKSKRITTNFSKAQIDKAPTFSTSRFNMDNSQGKVCSYFGAQQCSNM